MVQETTVIRFFDGELAWYPPGSGDRPRALADEADREQLNQSFASRRMRLCFAVPAEELRLQELAVAPEERRHLGKSLPFMLEEEFASDLEALHFAWMELEKLRVGVAACEKKRMDEWQARLADLPNITQWVPEPLLLPWHQGEWCLLLEGDRALLRTGRCSGFGIEKELLEPLLQAALEQGPEPEQLVLYGQDREADIGRLPGFLQARVQWRRGGFNTAMMVSSAEPVLNLRQGRYAPRLPLERWWRQWRVAAALFAAAFVVQLAATYADYHRLEKENLALRSAVQESYRSAFPRGAIVDPEKQLRRQLESLRGSGQSSGFVSLVNRVGEVVASQRGASIASINYTDRNSEMRVNLEARNFESVEAIRQGINRHGLAAELESSSARGDGVRARIRVGGSS